MTMRQILITSAFILIGFSLFAQNNDTWIAFWGSDSTHMGFKDKSGIIRIEPKFMGLTSAHKFDNIMAVMEDANGSYHSYYLTKEGRMVGKDSLYVYDNRSDCESEGFIRFKNQKSDQVGMLNGKGKIVVPAEYNDLSRVRNGMIIALKGAKKKHWDKHSGCDHYSWTGGKAYLIDTNNAILIEDFKCDGDLNFFSLKKSLKPDKDTTRWNFLGSDGQFYSFVDFDKEFNSWLKSALLDSFTKEKLFEASNLQITYWKELGGWKSESKNEFIDRNFEEIKTRFMEIKSTSCEYHIFNEGLNPYIFESKEYVNYFNNCGESKDWIYPVKNVVITHKNKKIFYQNQFEFLRTDYGYKLITVSFGKGEIK
jgi:hypothetical protein